MINKKILVIRGKLDKLDNDFLKLIKKRTQLVNLVLSNKKYKKDRKRSGGKHCQIHERRIHCF